MTPQNDPPRDPLGPYLKHIDPLGFAISRTLCYLVWIKEHSNSFVKLRDSKPELAEQELGYLLHASDEALKHARHLRDLLLAGCTFDSAKKLPESLREQ